MSTDKQIEEMAKVLNECCNNYDENGNLLGNKCWGCAYWCDTNHICCSYNTKEATALYNAGYRKASDVAEEIFAEIERELHRMSTPIGEYTVIHNDRYAELKKKYTKEIMEEE